jgi:hypothetical protein
VGIPDFSIPVQRAVDRGLAGAAVLDVDGKPFAVAGALDDDEVRAVAGLVTCRLRSPDLLDRMLEGEMVTSSLDDRRLRSPDLLDRMLEGEMVTSSLDDREVSIGIAGRCVFVVVVLTPGLNLSRIQSGRSRQRRQRQGLALEPGLDLSSLSRMWGIVVDDLRVEVEQMISSSRANFSGSRPPGAPSSGGSSSGPAELQLIEFGVTVPRGDRN